MSSEYTGSYKAGKLKLKNNKTLFKADRTKNKKKNVVKEEVDEDKIERGGWRRITEDTDIRGGIDIAIECGDFSKCYLSAQDNGKFILGAQHFLYGESPNAEEILTVIKTPDDPKLSMKTGFGKYVGVDSEGFLIAVADAIGVRERFEIVFQDGKCAIQSASSGLFLNLNPLKIDSYVQVSSKSVSANEIVNIRTNVAKEGPVEYRLKEDLNEEGACEMSYVKMYQHSKIDVKNKLITCDINDKSEIKKAQKKGNLHEILLDRRTKVKSDKYC